ncbi:MAG: response regulator [Calditerrivibrio sp.]|nr:response regulator [Calditerrivibrio sp.]
MTKYSLKTAIWLYLIFTFLMIIGISFIMSFTLYEKLLSKEYDSFFQKNKKYAQNIFDNIINNLGTSIKTDSLNIHLINAIKQKNVTEIEKLLQPDTISNIFGVVSIVDDFVYKKDYLLYDTQLLINDVKKSITSQIHNNLIRLNTPLGNKTLIIVTKTVLDPKNGQLLAVLFRGVELNSYDPLIYDIVKGSMLDLISLYYYNELIISNSNKPFTKNNTLNYACVCENDYITYKTQLDFDGKPSPIILVMALKSTFFKEFQHKLIVWFSLFFILMVLLLMGITFFLNKMFLNPLLKIQDFAGRISTGEKQLEIPHFYFKEYENLAVYIKQVIEELYKARESAERSNKAKDFFLANISHELRTPLNSILGFAEILKNKETDPEKMSFIGNIYTSSEILMNLINDILEYSKIESGRFELQRVDFSLKEIALNLVNIFHLSASKKNIKLNLIFDDTLPPLVIGDKLRITQVLSNLLSNSIKFTEEGNITIEIKLLNKSSDLSKVLVRFSVKDTGIGINDTDKEKIFRPFTQADISITRKYGGTGLGLTISKKLVELMGGNLLLESEINKGSHFYFDLYLEVQSWNLDEKRDTNDIVDAVSNIDLNGNRILIVEDNIINQQLLKNMLKDHNATVDIASDGNEALNLYKTNKYNLILMDIQMPNMDGYTTTQKIRELDKDIPIIALTAAAMIEDREKALQAGMNEHLAKPFKKSTLIKTLQKYLLSNKKNKSDLIDNYIKISRALSNREKIDDSVISSFIKLLEGKIPVDTLKVLYEKIKEEKYDEAKDIFEKLKIS